jgi:hypothetical protein
LQIISAADTIYIKYLSRKKQPAAQPRFQMSVHFVKQNAAACDLRMIQFPMPGYHDPAGK